MDELKKKRIKAAEHEAKRFLEKVKELEDWKPKRGSFSSIKQIAAVKRSSMDLTRALADVRRSTFDY